MTDSGDTHEGQRTRAAIDGVRAGRMTLREFASELGLDAWQAHDLLASSGAPIGTGSIEETASALQDLIEATSRD